MCLFHQTKQKKHGNTAPYGPAAWGKTHIDGNSLGTCTQGSISPPTIGQQSPGICRPTNHLLGMPSQRPPPATHPIDKETFLTDRACPVTGHARSPAISHWAFTDHRPGGRDRDFQPSSHQAPTIQSPVIGFRKAKYTGDLRITDNRA